MELAFTIAFVLAASFIFSIAAKRFNISIVVSLIICGLIIGLPAIKGLLIEPNTVTLIILGDLALIFFMFIGGLESSWRMLYKERKDSVKIATFAFLLPFLLGFLSFLALGFSLMVSLIVGICMGITAEAAKARVLIDLNKLKTKVGAAMMGSGIMDNIVGIILFLSVIYVFGEFHIVENTTLIFAITSFFLGILVHKHIGRETKYVKQAEKAISLLMMPFLFISMGINFDFGSVLLNPLVAVTVIVVAFSGKMAGTLLAKPLTRLEWGQLYVIGWGMNSRGAVELALVMIALQNRLIPVEIFSSLILMTIITTMMFPLVVTRIGKDARMWNE